MQYFNVEMINRAIRSMYPRQGQGQGSFQDRSTTLARRLADNYYMDQHFVKTPGCVSTDSGPRDYINIRRLYSPELEQDRHCIFEIKGGGMFSGVAMIENIDDSAIPAIDSAANQTGSTSIWVIALKAVNIAVYLYHSSPNALIEAGIANYNGLVPLNQLITEEQYMLFHHDSLGAEEAKRCWRSYIDSKTFCTSPGVLREMGAECTNKISLHHIWNLGNSGHREEIHRLITYTTLNPADTILRPKR